MTILHQDEYDKPFKPQPLHTLTVDYARTTPKIVVVDPLPKCMFCHREMELVGTLRGTPIYMHNPVECKANMTEAGER